MRFGICHIVQEARDLNCLGRNFIAELYGRLLELLAQLLLEAGQLGFLALLLVDHARGQLTDDHGGLLEFLLQIVDALRLDHNCLLQFARLLLIYLQQVQIGLALTLDVICVDEVALGLGLLLRQRLIHLMYGVAQVNYLAFLLFVFGGHAPTAFDAALRQLVLRVHLLFIVHLNVRSTVHVIVICIFLAVHQLLELALLQKDCGLESRRVSTSFEHVVLLNCRRFGSLG